MEFLFCVNQPASSQFYEDRTKMNGEMNGALHHRNKKKKELLGNRSQKISLILRQIGEDASPKDSSFAYLPSNSAAFQIAGKPY